jgi:RHS repeat-associated protein
VPNRTKFEPHGYTAAGTTPGPTVASVATTGSAIGFTGHVNDPETDLVYMQQRYYDPKAGRFLSIDPVTTNASTGRGFNRYAYAANNPYKYIDRDGREEIPVVSILPPALIPLPPVVIPAPAPPRTTPYELPEPSRANEFDQKVKCALFVPFCGTKMVLGLIFSKPPRDAKSPTGAKAPGKPGEADGFKDPKGGENWVRNPNGHGSGWEAADGQVWVPTGPLAAQQVMPTGVNIGMYKTRKPVITQTFIQGV